MGRAKEYRQRLKYQVNSALKKTLENQLRIELSQHIGLSEAEAGLLSYRLADWLQRQAGFRTANQIIVNGATSHTAFSRGKANKQYKPIKVTPFQATDLALELEFGLKEMQLGRLLRLIEEAYAQDSLIDSKQLSLLCNITPTSLRSRLRAVMSLGIWVPTRGLSRKDRERGGLFRSTYLLQTYFSGGSLVQARRLMAVAKEDFEVMLSEFVAVIRAGALHPNPDAENNQWLEFAKSLPPRQLHSLIDEFPESARTADTCWTNLRTELQGDYELSPVKIRAIQGLLDETILNINQHRSDGDVIYWAVCSSEPAGKPLEACKLIPAKLTLLAEEDQPLEDNQDLNRLSEIKFRKAVRYATEAKFSGGYLNYADLSYLMGIHPEAIRRLVNCNPKVAIPLRGAECDIGRGVTHRRKIIELYLQMHTETEIVARTGHSYASIESYIREFGKVWLLYERGFPPPMIRKVTGRSMSLVNTYLELVKEYDKPEYAFRFQHLQTFVERDEKRLEKGGLN